MPAVVSVLRPNQSPVLHNHAYYARLYAYQHLWTEVDQELHPRIQAAFKYHFVLQKLRGLPEQDILLVLDGDTVIKDPLPLETILDDATGLVVEGPTHGGQKAFSGHMFIVRNCAKNRGLLGQLIHMLGKAIAKEPNLPHESDMLLDVGCRAADASVGGVYIDISWRVASWFSAKVFAVFLGRNQFPDESHFASEAVFHDPTLQRFLVDQVNATLTRGAPTLDPVNYPAISTDAYSAFSPQFKIALVTLYTHHINAYARVSEHNVKRYCDRHGMAYHVYRAIPAELDPSINGTWVKTWLIQRHLAQHEWVIWVDADTIFLNQSLSLPALLEGRDLLLAKDLGGWPFNAGVMGFRNTPQNWARLQAIWSRIEQVEDKSTVYSSMGDQFHTVTVLQELGALSDEAVVDFLTVNTPPCVRTPNSLLVHYVGLGEPYRSAQMAHDDTLSKRLG